MTDPRVASPTQGFADPLADAYTDDELLIGEAVALDVRPAGFILRAGGGVIDLTSAVPATVARPPRRDIGTIATATAMISTAPPKKATGELDMPSPRAITKAAIVPMIHATSLRAGAMGRPIWFATVDLPVVPVRL
jgi:hypothetical protein